MPTCGTLDLALLVLLALVALDLWAFGEAGVVGLLLSAVMPRRRAHAGRESLVGARAVAERAFEPEAPHGLVGPVRVGGERWRARLASGHPAPEAGARLVVTAVDGLTLEVEPERKSAAPR